ncbi:conserved hypothetical protein [Ricinus communis]|uniref:Uncharacterized protein n=1 Tax=Ricinus communis TaxID=3988 RepID=B9RRL7_RICCO|nr:conserved hypothetical protein [Ricinus communis]
MREAIQELYGPSFHQIGHPQFQKPYLVEDMIDKGIVKFFKKKDTILIDKDSSLLWPPNQHYYFRIKQEMKQDHAPKQKWNPPPQELNTQNERVQQIPTVLVIGKSEELSFNSQD